jgi:hypothetical protein
VILSLMLAMVGQAAIVQPTLLPSVGRVVDPVAGRPFGQTPTSPGQPTGQTAARPVVDPIVPTAPPARNDSAPPPPMIAGGMVVASATPASKSTARQSADLTDDGLIGPPDPSDLPPSDRADSDTSAPSDPIAVPVAPPARRESVATMAVAVPVDRFGFGPMINAYRASYGLRPLAYDPALTAWCLANNRACMTAYSGACPPVAANGYPALHLVYEKSSWQNAGWGYATAADALAGWRASAGHNAALLHRNIGTYGIEYGPGSYWTLQLR